MKREHEQEEPVGRCQREGCPGSVFPVLRTVNHEPSFREMMDMPVGPNMGAFERQPDIVLVGYGCDTCGILYAFVPDAFASKAELKRRHKRRDKIAASERKERQEAYNSLRTVLERYRVQVTNEELVTLVDATLDESAEILSPVSSGGSIEGVLDTLSITWELGEAICRVVDWETVGNAGARRFLSRVAQLFERSEQRFEYNGEETINNVAKPKSSWPDVRPNPLRY